MEQGISRLVAVPAPAARPNGRGDRPETVPSAGGVTARRPSALGTLPRGSQCYDCGHGLGMILRKSSKKFEELPPGLV
jgi:hypothetical protein